MKRTRASFIALSALISSCSGGSLDENQTSVGRERQSEGAIVVDAGALRQPISGFGASSAWTGGNLTLAMADLLFSREQGIGLSLLRVHIQPDGKTTETPTARLAVERGVTVWASPWSPPGEWKTSGTDTNGGSLLPEYYQAWADRLVDFVETTEAQGIPLFALSAQNEPNWVAEWETCEYTPEELHTFIRDYLGPTLRSESPATKLMAPESANWNSLAQYANPLLADPDTSALLDIVAVHAYGGVPYTYQPALDAGKELWETEISYDQGEGIVATLETARQIQRHLVVANVNAFHYWWLVGNAEGGGLTANGELTPQAHGLAHYSKFIRPGFVRLDVPYPAVAGLTLSAYTNPVDGQVVVVAVNETETSLPQHFHFENTTALEIEPWLTTAAAPLTKQPRVPYTAEFDYSLTPLSVTTLIVTNEPESPAAGGSGGSGTAGQSGAAGEAGAPANGGEGGSVEATGGNAGNPSEGGAPTEPNPGTGGTGDPPAAGGEDSSGDGGEPSLPEPSDGGVGAAAGSTGEGSAGGRRVPAPYSACLCAAPGKPVNPGTNAWAMLPLFALLLRRRRSPV